MSRRFRTFVGTVAILVFVCIYALVAMALADSRIVEAPKLIQTVVYLLLGVGWNFLFVGSTTLLTTTFRPAERYAAQAANDFAVFGAQAVASLAAGALVHRLGWAQLNLAVAPLLALLLVVLVVASRRRAEA